MKNKFSLLIIAGVLVTTGLYAKSQFYPSPNTLRHAELALKRLVINDTIKDGDIIFQTSISAQSKAIQLATHSVYSHCGIIYKNAGAYFVYEAVEPVKLTPLNKWIARGQGGHFVIKRLKNAAQILTPAVLQKMKASGNQFMGSHYDIYFEWSNDKIYCSELVWKIYKTSAGIEVGKLEKLKDFDLSNPVVKQKMKERYGDHIPLEEPVISPESIFSSDLLMTVQSN